MTTQESGRLVLGKWFWWLTLAVAVVAAAKFLHPQAQLQAAVNWAGQLGAWGPVLFILLYVVATVLLIPGSVLALGAGAIFGVLHGSMLVSLASTLGAGCAFLVSRYLAREAVTRKFGINPKFAALDQAVGEAGWKIVLLTRLSPVFPFTWLNYAFGLTRVSFRDYVIASWLGMLPGTVMYVYLGSLVSVGVSPRSRTPVEWGLYGLGVVATVVVTVFIARIARRALAHKVTRGDDDAARGQPQTVKPQLAP